MQMQIFENNIYYYLQKFMNWLKSLETGVFFGKMLIWMFNFVENQMADVLQKHGIKKTNL